MSATRRVVVTGAAAGIGLAVTRKLLERECHVIGVDRDGAADDLNDPDERYSHVTTDIRRGEDLARLRAKIVGEGRVGSDDVRAGFGELTALLKRLNRTDLAGLRREIDDLKRDLAAAGAGYRDIVDDLDAFETSYQDDGAVRSSDQVVDEVRAKLQQLRAGLRRSGSISHLILAAGGSHKDEICPQDPLDISSSVFHESVDLNLTAQYQVIRHLVPAMRSESGEGSAITTVSSINSLGSLGAPAYSAAKGGLSGLVRSLADPLGKLDIRINNVVLGTVDTANSRLHHAGNGGRIEMLEELSPLRRVLTPEQAADIVIGVTMTAGATGQDHVFDNGQSLARRGSYTVTG